MFFSVGANRGQLLYIDYQVYSLHFNTYIWEGFCGAGDFQQFQVA